MSAGDDVGDELAANELRGVDWSGSPSRMPRGVAFATRSTPVGSASPTETRPGKRSARRATMRSPAGGVDVVHLEVRGAAGEDLVGDRRPRAPGADEERSFASTSKPAAFTPSM